ncbi:MAG TPA: PAS domain S-box protein [Desulfomonilia bacterium]
MEKVKPVSLNADFYRKLIEDANIIIFRMALPEGKFEYVSPGCIEITGYEPQEFYDDPMLIRKFIHPDWQPVLQERFNEILMGEIKPFYEYKIIHKSGVEKWIHHKNVVEYGSDGRPVAIESVITDVSGLKKIEVELAASENKFRLAFNNSPNILAISSIDDGVFIEVNDNFEKILGWRREDITGKSAFELGLVRDKARRDELIEIIKRDGHISSYEIEMITKSGEIRTGEFSAEIIDVNNKKCLIMQVNDITERKKVEKALKESREQYRHLIYNFPDGIIIHKEGKILYGNPAAMKLFGSMNPEDYAGKTMFDFVPENSHGLLMERRRQFKEGKTPPQIEIKCLDIKGNLIDVAITVSHVYFKGEKAVMTIFHDITDRKKIEEALFRSEQQYRLISENMQDTLWLMDMDFKTVWISPSVVKTRGFTLEELQSMPIDRHLTPESYDIAMKILAEELTPERLADRDCEISRMVELEFICKDGTIFTGEIRMTLLRDSGGKPIGFLGVGRDISERKKAENEKQLMEKQIQQAQKLESIGVLAGGIAHDFNNMLTAIIGNSELALLDISETSPAVQRLQNVIKVAMSAAGLCKQMLAYSGKGAFQMVPINLTGLIREMEQMLIASISKKAKLDLILDEKIPFIKADLPQIQQIIMNLVINSSEAIGEDTGTITIMTRQIECSGEYLKTLDLGDEMVEGVYVCMEISDTGCGMDRETMGKIFDPFFTTKFTGRGLGLAAVLGIVRSHKGALKIYSEPGRGTTFKIFFPATEPFTGTNKVKAEQEQTWQGSGTIMLVDDDDQIRNVCKKMLERIGFDVITAVDGKDALDVFRRNRDKIRCVILDMTMPIMDGKEAYGELMLIDPDVRVIISSGYNGIEVMNSFKEKGPDGFIQKPYQFENMKEELKKVLGR